MKKETIEKIKHKKEEKQWEKDKIINKDFLKRYFISSFIIIFGLTMIHYPPEFFTGTTIEFIAQKIFSDKVTLFALFLKIIFTSIVFMPFLIFAKQKYIGWIPLALFSIAVGFEKYIFYIQGSQTPWNVGFGEDMLLNAIANPTGIQDSIRTYGGDIYFYLYLVAFPALLFSILIFLSSKLPKISRKNNLYKYYKTLSFFLIIFAATFFISPNNILYMFRVQSTLTEHLKVKVEELAGIKRLPIHFKDVNKTNQPKNIMFIIDESVRGDLISINNPTDKDVMKTTPYLYSIKDKIINFGNLYSQSNCSISSNKMSLTSLNKKTINKNKNYFKVAPTILQYMKNAGYKTYVVDNVHNGLYFLYRLDDRNYIDGIVNDFQKYQKYTSYDRDFHTLDEIKKILNNDEKNFLMVIKYGTHFPFQNAFDQKKPLFKDWGLENNIKRYHMYLNALQTSVDKYWKYLIKTIGDTDTVVIWKSDHSVNITNNSENDIIITHCEASWTHYKELTSIPGVMYSPNKKYYEGYHNLKNGYSGKHIFATLLDLAGYSPKDYKKFYGPSFKEPSEKVQIMIAGRIFEMGEDDISDYISFDRREKISKLNKKRTLKNEIKRKEYIEVEN